MRKLLLTCFILLVAVGCSGDKPQVETVTAEPPPLSVEEWKQLPADKKYDGATLDYLREQDPKLKSERAWNQFMKEVVAPERDKDYPGEAE